MNMRLISTFSFLFLLTVLGGVQFGFCTEFEDALGRKINLEGQPQRIVSLAPSITETLYYLGLGDRVVGVTQFSYYPPEAALKPKVGSYVDVNVEKILTLSPDLVIGTMDGNEAEKVYLLEEAGVAVFVVNPRNVRQAVETVATVSHVCGVPEKGAALSLQLSKRVDDIMEKIRGRKKPLVFLQINLKPIMTVNRNTYLHDLIQMAGGENIAKDEPITYPRISLEEVIRKKPEVIIISSMDRGGQFQEAKLEWQRWTTIPAVKNKRIHLIDSDLVDRPSPRIVEGLELIARLLHPEAGWE
jgi:iron complex transport system substrate-binding protein